MKPPRFGSGTGKRTLKLREDVEAPLSIFLNPVIMVEVAEAAIQQVPAL